MEAENEERDNCLFGKSHETGVPINWTGTRLVNDNVNNYQARRRTPPRLAVKTWAITKCLAATPSISSPPATVALPHLTPFFLPPPNRLRLTPSFLRHRVGEEPSGGILSGRIAALILKA